MPGRLLELTLQLGDPGQDPAPIGLQLGLAGPSHRGAHPGALLGEGGFLSPETGEVVAEQSELDLDGADLRGGVLGEDVEDQGLPVDDVDVEDLLEVALLGGAQ